MISVVLGLKEKEELDRVAEVSGIDRYVLSREYFSYIEETFKADIMLIAALKKGYKK